MTKSPYQKYYDYLAEHVITPFYNVRLNNLNSLHLTSVLKRKNPYLFKAKNIELASDLVKSIVDAFLSSQEETIFGNLLEGFAIHVSQTLYGGFKSELKSVDLGWRDDMYYIVGIKSGTNWGNSDQVNKMRENFKIAKKLLRQRGVLSKITAVNGCIYGKDRVPLKKHTDREKQYYKYAGQEFWQFISGDNNLYREIITPIDKEARQKDETFKKAYIAKINEMTKDFITHFMTNNEIDWTKLVDYVSKSEDIKLQPPSKKRQSKAQGIGMNYFIVSYNTNAIMLIERVMMETLTSIRRAGADIILTYYAREAIRALASAASL